MNSEECAGKIADPTTAAEEEEAEEAHPGAVAAEIPGAVEEDEITAVEGAGIPGAVEAEGVAEVAPSPPKRCPTS